MRWLLSQECSYVLWLGGTGTWGRLYSMGGRGHRSPKFCIRRGIKSFLDVGLGRRRNQESICCVSMRTWAQILSTFKSWAWQPYLISEALAQVRDLLASFWGTHWRLTAGLHLHMCTWTRIYAHMYSRKGVEMYKNDVTCIFVLTS